MSGTGFSIALACGGLGLVLSAAPARQGWLALALLAVMTLATGKLPFALALQPMALKALGAGTIVTAALAYLGSRAAPLLGLAAANLGFWLGVLFQSGETSAPELALGGGCVLLFFPARFLHERGMQVATYVVASWIITAGFINLVFALLQPSGPVMDHML